MLLDSKELDKLLQAVNLDKYEAEDKTILLFVANSDVDSVCSVKQLQAILYHDESHFSQHPVECYEEIRVACEPFKSSKELRTIFFINCGASTDLRSKIGLQDHPNIRLIIIDSHRPIWPGHVHSSMEDTLVVLDDDDPVPADVIPKYDENDDKLLEAGVKGYMDEEERDDAEEEDQESSPSAKRRRKDREDELRIRRDALEAYYEKYNGFGKPTALLLYNLARNKNQDRTMSIWLGILGLTDQLVHHRISRAHYDKWRKAMELDLQKHDGRVMPPQDSSSSAAERHDQIAIATVTDMRLTMLSGWSLSNTLLYCPYSASRLQTWTEKGKANVKLLLAKMNIEPDQSNAQYSAMASKLKTTLPNQLQKHGMDFGLNLRNLTVEGFELRYKHDVRICASDMVAMMSTELGKPRENSTESMMGFHDATDILDVDISKEHQTMSMERVKYMCQAIVQQGGLAITRNQVHGFRRSKFWYFDMSSLEMANKQDFRHPIVLCQMAIFLRDAMIRRVSTNKAMILVGTPDTTNHCYVVALRAKETAGALQNNQYARPFADVAAKLMIPLPKTTFDTSLFYIHKNDSVPFIEELKIIISTKYADDATTAVHTTAA